MYVRARRAGGDVSLPKEILQPQPSQRQQEASPPACPYCGFVFTPPPRRNRKWCPNCSRQIAVRLRRSDRAKVVVGREKPPVSLGTVVREDLPFPVVYYPGHYGTFIAFAEDECAPVALCACSESAIRNFLRLQQEFPKGYNSNPLRMAPLDSYFFPEVVARASLVHDRDPLRAARFCAGLCHRCNLARPSVRHCHEVYGGVFKQQYGWYISQNYLRLGMLPAPLPEHLTFLEDVCPGELQAKAVEVKAANEEYRREEARLMAIVTGPPRLDIPRDEVTYWSNVRLSEAQTMITLRRRAARLWTEFQNTVENITRQEFGFRKVGEGWVSETLLAQIVSHLMPHEEMLRHHKPDWLEGLELDLYIPRLRLGIEYQGQQHFCSIKAWGGDEALAALQERDARKARLCRRAGVRLVAIDYTQPLTEEHILALLALQ